MIQNSGPKNWSTYTWYQVGTDLGAGASATIFDADILGYFMNGGDNKEKGNLGFQAFAANPDAKAPTPNVWIWSLAMNSFGKQKDAAWYWMQWASSAEHDLFGARKMDFVNPVRASVWKDDEFRSRIDKSYSGYLKQHDASAPGAKIYFTPQPLFFDVTRNGRKRCRRWSPRRCRSRKGSTSSPTRSTSSSRMRVSADETAHDVARAASSPRAPRDPAVAASWPGGGSRPARPRRRAGGARRHLAPDE